LSKADVGDASLLKGGKFDTEEGGVRVPFIAEWPGQLPTGVATSEPMMTIDLFPTLLNLAGAENFIPTDRTIDGRCT
jgi:arylsulfatase A